MDDNAISSNTIPDSQQNDALSKNIFDSMQEMLVKPEDNHPDVKGTGKMQKLFYNSNKPVQWNTMFSRLSQNKELHKFCKTATSNKENKVKNKSLFETVHCNEKNLNNTKSNGIVPNETDNYVGSVNTSSKENNSVTIQETKQTFSDDHENQRIFKPVTTIINSTDNVNISEHTQHSVEDISCDSVTDPDSSGNYNTSDERKSCTETHDEIVSNSEFTEKENVNDLKKSVIDNDCKSNDLRRSIINSECEPNDLKRSIIDGDYQHNNLKRSIIDKECEPSDLKRSIVNSDCEANDLKRSIIDSDCEPSDLKSSIIDSDWEPSDFKRSIIDSDCESMPDDMPDSWVVKDEIGAGYTADTSKESIGPNSECESDVNKMSMNDLVVLDETSSSDDEMNNISPQRSKTSFNESPQKSGQKLKFPQQNIKRPLELNAMCVNKGLDSYDPLGSETLTKSPLPIPNGTTSEKFSDVSLANRNSSSESSLMMTFSTIKGNQKNLSDLNNSKNICPDSEKFMINSETLRLSSPRSSLRGSFQDVRTSSPINMSTYSDVSDGETEDYTTVKDDDALSLISSDESFYSEGVDIVGDFFELDQYENASPVQTRSPEMSNTKPSPMSSPESILSKTSHHSRFEKPEAVDSKMEFIEECGKSILDNNSEISNTDVSMDFLNKDRRRSSFDSLQTIDSLHTVSDCSDNEKDVYDRPEGSSSVPESVLSSSETPSRTSKATTADIVSTTTSKIDINSDLSNSGQKLPKSGEITSSTIDNVTPNNCKTKNFRPPTPLLDEKIEGDFSAPLIDELMSGSGHQDLVTSNSLDRDQNVTVRSSTPLLDERNESESNAEINQSAKQGSMLYSTVLSTKEMVVTQIPFTIETNETGRSSTPVLDEKNELNITNKTNQSVSPQKPATIVADTEKNKDQEHSQKLQSVDTPILSQSSNVEISIKTCECDMRFNKNGKEASDQKLISQSGASEEYVKQFKNPTTDQNQVPQRNPSRTNLEPVSLPHINYVSSGVKENDSSCYQDVIVLEKNNTVTKKCRPIVVDFQNAMMKIKNSSTLNHECLHQTSDLEATSFSVQEKRLSVFQVSNFSEVKKSTSKSLLRDDSQQDPNQFSDQDNSLPPLQIDEAKIEYLTTSQKSDDIIMGYYPNLFGNSQNTCISINSEIQESNEFLENKQKTTSSAKSCRKISGTSPQNKNEKNSLPYSKKKTSPKIKPGRIEKSPGYSVAHANNEKAMEHYYSQPDQPLYIEKYQSSNNNAGVTKINPKFRAILNETTQVPSLPAVEKKKNYQGGFMVGRMNGAFICLKCKCKFYDRKNFRWHLWHHVHRNADRCPSCDSTDPLSPCETTEGLLNFISNMENKEAFFVTPQKYLKGKVNKAEIQHSPRIANDPHCSKHLTRESEKKHTNDANTNEKGLQTDDTTEKADIGHSLLPIKILNTFSMSTGEFLPSDDSRLTNDHNTNKQKDTSSAAVDLSNSSGYSTTTTKHNLKDSSNIQTSGCFFKCSVCHKSYLHEKLLEDHLFAAHDSTTCFKCVYCGFETFDKLDYASHYAIHIKSVGFDCLYPGCNDKSDILGHHLKHLSCHKNWKPSCCRCHLNFDNIHLLSEHYEQNMVSFFACSYCDAKAIERSTFLEHVTKDHALVGLNVRVTNLLVCNISSNVNKLGQNNSPLVQPSTVGNKTDKDHIHSNKPPNSNLSFSTFLCQKCSFVCNDKKVFLAHKKIHIAPRDLSVSMPFTCPCCPTSFCILTELMFHLGYHDKDLQFSLYQCPEDGFITNDRQKGKIHLSQINHTNVELYQIKTYHHESQIYHCSFCGIKVKEKSIFIQHLSIHGRLGEEKAEVLKEAEDDENVGKKFVSNIHQLNFKTTGSSDVKDFSLSKETQSSIATTKKHFKSQKDCEIKLDINETFTYENNIPYVTKLYNLVIKSTPSYKNCAQALDQKLKILYSHQSGFFVCAICNEKYCVKSLLFNHLVEHLGILYRCYKCGIFNKTYDNAICHALKFHQTERNSVVYSESLAEKVRKLAEAFPSTTVLHTTRAEVSNHVTQQPQEKSFTANRNKTKVFTRLKVMESNSNSEITTNCTSELETTAPTQPPAEINDEELCFLAEEDTVKAFSCLIRRGIECSWCKMCGKAFSLTLPGKNQLYHHLLTIHLKYKPHNCFHCPFSAYSAKVLTNHIKTMHVGINILSFTVRNIVEYVIDLIKESGLDIDFSGLLEHRDSDSVPSSSVDTSSTISASYSCEMCSATFDCPYKILRHKKTAHSGVFKNTARKSAAPSTSTIRNLQHHKSAQIRLPGYTARKSTCAKPLRNAARKSTIQNKRPITYGNTPEKKLFKCPKCDYITEKRHRAMLYHFSKKHSFECFIQCCYCQAKFTNKDLWLKHSSLIHSGQEMQFKTLPIENYFIPWNTSDNLQVEQFTQQNKPEEQPQAVETSGLKSLLPHLVCVFCNLEEIKEEYMRYHLYIHLDYKPFKCNLCKKAYSDPFQQKQHICLEHASKQDKAYTETIELYENKVEELLSDCKKSVKNDLDYIPWNLHDVLNTLSDSFTELKEADSSDFQTEDTLCSNQDYHDETLQKLQQISPRKILGSYDKEDQSPIRPFRNHADDVHDQETDKSKTIKFSSKRKTISLSDYSSQNSDSSGPLLKKIKLSPGGFDSMSNKSGAKSKPLNKTKSSSAISLESLVNSSSSSSLGIKRSPGEEPSSKSKWKKHKSSNSGEFDNHNIMCYYCSYSSEAVSHVISHTQQQHVGRNWVALLWIDKITGGTYDHDGNIFSNGFDSDVVIEERFLCGLCNFRSKDMVNVLEHEDTEHENIVGSSLVELKTIIACTGSRRHRSANSSNLSKTVNKPDKQNKPQLITEIKKSPGKLKPVSNGMTYTCSVCSVLTTSEYQFRRHLATHSNFCCLVPDLSQNPQLKCWNCSFRATSIESFTKHLTKQVAIIKYECGHCGYRAGSPRAVKIHNRSKHSEKEPNIWEVSDETPSCANNKNLSLIVDLEPHVRLEDFQNMTQARFDYLLQKRPQKILH